MENKTTAAILRMRREIQEFCQKHSRLLRIVSKFIVSFLLFYTINDLYGGKGGTALMIALALAVICAGLPMRYAYLFSVLQTAVYLYQVSWDVLAFYLAAVLLSYLMICRIRPEAGVIIAFAPLFFQMKLPFLLPLLVGMFSNMFGIGAMIFGVAFYYFGIYVQDVALLLNAATGDENIIAVKNVMEAFSKDQQCMLLMAAFVVAAVVMYLVYHQSFDYAWYIAILAGGLVGFFVYLAGGLIFDIQSRNVGYMVGILGAMIVAAVIQFFRCIIDYGSVEYIEFEDDEYYYYVKAVPKVTVLGEDFVAAQNIAEERTVRKFTQEDDK
ncbi:MAG: hypothetical protein Q4B70_00610 [Lachnospiraceae bacterium]|nr:hypothetical protein [Lachnospiraceae bacterium]